MSFLKNHASANHRGVLRPLFGRRCSTTRGLCDDRRPTTDNPSRL